MIELFVSAFVTFLVVIDPPGCAPIFASITAGTTAQHRRAMIGQGRSREPSLISTIS